MKVALIQLKAGRRKHENLRRAFDLVRRAAKQKAEFILLPEVFVFRGRRDRFDEGQAVPENIPGESTKPLMVLAKQYKAYILAGSVFEKLAGASKVCNTSVLINPRGEIQSKYRKIHLFDANVAGRQVRESSLFEAGKRPVLTRVGPWPTGLSICYDLRFPDLFQKYALAGARLLCIPSAFTYQTGKAHWEILLRARAIENRCYVLAPNQCGRDERGIHCYGNSMIVDPWGKIIARAGADEKIIFAKLSTGAINKMQKTFLKKSGI